MTQEGVLVLRDAVFVTKTENGKVRVIETTDPSTGQAAMGGAFWGLLFGVLLFVPVLGMAIGAGTAAIVSKLTDTGVSHEFIQQLRGSIEPGHVYLAALVSHVDSERALAEMRRWAGMAELVSANIPAERFQALKDVLDEVDVTAGVSDEDSTIRV
jgi:uncharacterized membrane protein